MGGNIQILQTSSDIMNDIMNNPDQCTEVRFASFFSGGFTTMAVINPPERKLAKRISVHWLT